MRVLGSTLAIAMLAQFCLGQTSPKTAGPSPQSSSQAFVIAVDGPTAPVHLDSPININITVTNVSGKEIWWQWDRYKDATYKAFTVLLTKGDHEVETTFFHRKVNNRQRADDPVEGASGSLFPVTYPPGKMFTITIDLKRLQPTVKGQESATQRTQRSEHRDDGEQQRQRGRRRQKALQGVTPAPEKKKPRTPPGHSFLHVYPSCP